MVINDKDTDKDTVFCITGNAEDCRFPVELEESQLAFLHLLLAPLSHIRSANEPPSAVEHN